MRFSRTARRGLATVAVASSVALVASGCSAGSLGSSSDAGSGSAGAAAVTITYLIPNDDATAAQTKAVIAAFQSANPGITINTDTRPGGTDGDNIIKTRLATGDMAEVFQYNNGSLLQAIKPEQNLTALDDQPWAGQLDDNFAA